MYVSISITRAHAHMHTYTLNKLLFAPSFHMQTPPLNNIFFHSHTLRFDYYYYYHLLLDDASYIFIFLTGATHSWPSWLLCVDRLAQARVLYHCYSGRAPLCLCAAATRARTRTCTRCCRNPCARRCRDPCARRCRRFVLVWLVRVDSMLLLLCAINRFYTVVALGELHCRCCWWAF